MININTWKIQFKKLFKENRDRDEFKDLKELEHQKVENEITLLEAEKNS